MFEKSDKQLIDGALRGKPRSWHALVKRYESKLYNYGLRMTGNRDDALDLLQEVFTSVYRNLSNYSGSGTFQAWMFKIAHYRCIEFYRRKRPTEALDDAPELICDAQQPEEIALGRSNDKELYVAMQRLPLAQKAVIELKFFEQFTFDEIADLLGVSSNTVKSRLYSALGKLRTDLEVQYAS